MKHFRLVILLVLISILSGNCALISNTLSYSETTKSFIESLLKKDYNKCIGLLAMNNPGAANANIDTLKSRLADFRNIIVNNFGDKLEYTFMTAEKKWSTNAEESTPPNTTRIQMQFSNPREFGVLQVLFDDHSKKILNIKTLDIKAPVPQMTNFWLFGLLALCVPVFNIYMIVRIKRSQYKIKWLKYLAIIVLNVPEVIYSAISGISLQLLSFQILFGISFQYTGYINAAWSFGIPIAGLYLLWQLRKGKDKPINLSPETVSPQTTGDMTNDE